MTPAIRHRIRAAVIDRQERDPDHAARFLARCNRLRAMTDPRPDPTYPAHIANLVEAAALRGRVNRPPNPEMPTR